MMAANVWESLWPVLIPLALLAAVWLFGLGLDVFDHWTTRRGK